MTTGKEFKKIMDDAMGQGQAVANDFLMSPSEQAMWLENTASQIENLNATIRHLSVKAEAYDALVKLINPPSNGAMSGWTEEQDYVNMRRRAKNILAFQRAQRDRILAEQIAADNAAAELAAKRKAQAKKRARTIAAKKPALDDAVAIAKARRPRRAKLPIDMPAGAPLGVDIL